MVALISKHKHLLTSDKATNKSTYGALCALCEMLCASALGAAGNNKPENHQPVPHFFHA